MQKTIDTEQIIELEGAEKANLKEIIDSNNNYLYLLFNIRVEKNLKVILNTKLPVRSKLWCNSKIISIYGIDENDESRNIKFNHPCINLIKGINKIIIEIINPTLEILMGIQILNYKTEIIDNYESLIQLGNITNFQNINYVCEKIICNKTFKYSFMIMKNNNICENQIQYKLYNFSGQLLEERNVEFNKVITIDFNKLCILYNDLPINNYFLLIKVKKKNGSFFNKCHNIILQDPDELITFLGNSFKKDEINFNEIDFSKRNYGLIDVYKLCFNIYSELFVNLGTFEDIYNSIEFENLNNGKVIIIKYISQLDLSDQRIMLRLPKDYNKDLEYPLVLHIAIGQYGWYSYDVDCFEVANSLIYADISVRGQTLGGYVGEANFLESLEILSKNYKINKDQIYILGASNAGYATWRLLQKLPYIFAAGYPLGAFPIINEIVNIYNVPILTLISDLDHVFKDRKDILKNKMKDNNNYLQVEIDGTNHSQLINYAINKKVLEFFLSKKINKYPSNIYFITNQNRYRKSYWIEIHEISFGKQEASVFAAIKSESLIELVVLNSNGLSVELPPQININYFKITINDIIFEFNNIGKSVLHFRRNDLTNKYEYIEDFQINYKTLSLKGSGLLHVYYDRLRVIIPDISSDIITKVAYNLSHPVSNSNSGYIATDYPIFKRSMVDNELLTNNNLIIISVNRNNQINSLELERYIRIDNTKFAYKGIDYEGDYVIMQVLKNPFNYKLSILYIETNNEESLLKNLFLRKLILSGEFNGSHPYLNNEALIFYKNSYSAIYEWEDELNIIL